MRERSEKPGPIWASLVTISFLLQKSKQSAQWLNGSIQTNRSAGNLGGWDSDPLLIFFEGFPNSGK